MNLFNNTELLFVSYIVILFGIIRVLVLWYK